MRVVLLGALLIAGQLAYSQEPQPSPNEAPAGRSSDSGKTPEHTGAEHASEAVKGESTHGAASTEQQGEEHAKAAVEHGEGEAEHAMPNEIWWKWANFGILVLGLGYLIKKNAGPFLAARTAGIQKGITEASQMKADAEARAREIELRIGNLSAEVDALRRKGRDDIAAQASRLERETAQQLEKIRKQAEAEIAAAAKHAAAELKAYSAELAMNQAGRQVRDRITPELQQDLVDAFVSDLERQRAGKHTNGVVR